MVVQGLPSSYGPRNLQLIVQPLVQASSLHVLHDHPQVSPLEEACSINGENVRMSELGEDILIRVKISDIYLIIEEIKTEGYLNGVLRVEYVLDIKDVDQDATTSELIVY